MNKCEAPPLTFTTWWHFKVFDYHWPVMKKLWCNQGFRIFFSCRTLFYSLLRATWHHVSVDQRKMDPVESYGRRLMISIGESREKLKEKGGSKEENKAKKKHFYVFSLHILSLFLLLSSSPHLVQPQGYSFSMLPIRSGLSSENGLTWNIIYRFVRLLTTRRFYSINSPRSSPPSFFLCLCLSRKFSPFTPMYMRRVYILSLSIVTGSVNLSSLMGTPEANWILNLSFPSSFLSLPQSHTNTTVFVLCHFLRRLNCSEWKIRANSTVVLYENLLLPQ